MLDSKHKGSNAFGNDDTETPYDNATLDYDLLKDELKRLQACFDTQRAALYHVVLKDAMEAADKKDKAGVLKHLANLGVGAFKLAKEIGLQLVTNLLADLTK